MMPGIQSRGRGQDLVKVLTALPFEYARRQQANDSRALGSQSISSTRPHILRISDPMYGEYIVTIPVEAIDLGRRVISRVSPSE
jgi:hypothetical protein